MKPTIDQFLLGLPGVPETLSGEALKQSLYNMFSDGYDFRQSELDHPDVSVEENLFKDFVKAYPGTKRGWKTEIDNFLKKYKKNGEWQTILPTLKAILDKQIKHKAYLSKQGQFVAMWPNLSTYINQRRWEEVIPEIPITIKQVERERKFITIPGKPE